MLNKCDKICSEELMNAIKTLESKINRFETKFETKIDQLESKIDQLEETISAITNDKQLNDTKPDNQKKALYSFI